ncbi:MAG: S-layer domain protein [Myxococcales bacterium]|nr:S-layer domain protein [Myxococcales bacterium]
MTIKSVLLMSAIVFASAWSRPAAAQKGNGYPCTSGWATSYDCEMFSWNSGSPSPVTLWNVSDGYCYVNALNFGANAQGTINVVATNGVWTLNSTLNGSDKSAIATCVSFPEVGPPVQANQSASNNALTTISTNASFCGIAGIQYNQSAATNANFQVAANAYPASPKTVNLGEVVQNSLQGNGIFGECLAAPGQLWWGNSTLANAIAGQNVFVYEFGPGYNVTDLPAQNAICAFTMIFPGKGQPIWSDIEVDDETGNWAVYSLQGTVQVACITMPPLVSRAAFRPSGSAGSTGAASALDGKVSTRWTTNHNQTAGQFFQVDMGSMVSISRITMDAANDTSDYPRGYQVFLSSDGTHWGTNVSSGAGSPFISSSFPKTTARYLKIVQTSSASKWWSLHELNVYH